MQMASGKYFALIALAVLPAFAVPAQDNSACLTLSDAVASALKGNADLAAFAFDVRAAEARQIQAGLRPNPELSVEAENVPIGDDPQTRNSTWSIGAAGVDFSREKEQSDSEEEITIALSQVIELGGKRARRLDLAMRDHDVLAWDYEIARGNVLRDVAKAYINVLTAQERVSLDNDLVNLSEQVLDAVKGRVEAGRVSPLEESKAQTALSSARIQAQRSERGLQAARTRLASLWGETEAAFAGVSGKLDEMSPLPDFDTLATAIEETPDLKRWQAELEKRGAAVKAEKANSIPDMTVSAGFRTTRVADSESSGFGAGSEGLSYSTRRSRAKDDWDNSVVLGVSVPLPLFNRNQGTIKEAEHLAAKASEERRAAVVGVHVALREAYENAAGAYAAILALRDGMLPMATQTYVSFNEAYLEGKSGSLDMLDAQRTLFELRHDYLQALTDYHIAAIDIERLTGMPIGCVASAAAPGKEN